MTTETEVGWSKCWTHGCEKSSEILLRLERRLKPFRLVWYCSEHSATMQKQYPSAKVMVRLKFNENGTVVRLG